MNDRPREESGNADKASSSPTAAEALSLLSNLDQAFALLDKNGRFIFANKKTGELLKQSFTQSSGKLAGKEFGKTLGTELEHQLQDALATGSPMKAEIFHEPSGVWLEMRTIPSSEGMAVYLHDVSERRRRQQFHIGQMEILERIAAGAPQQEVLAAVVRLAESQSPDNRCSILLLDSSGHHLQHGSAPNLPPAFIQGIDNVEIGPSAGSCGTAAYERRNVIVTDIAIDPLWEKYRALALSHGLRACWSVPIMSGSKEVLGTFAVYSSAPRAPKSWEIDLLATCSHLVSVAIERHRASQALLENERRFREQASLLDKAQDAIIVRRLDGTVMFWNKSAERLFGWTQEEALGRTIRELVYEDDSTYREVTEQVLQQGELSSEATLRRKDGSPITVEGRWTLVRDEDGNPQSIFSINTDITQRKVSEKEIHNLAFYDPLTRLPNRLLLLDRLQNALAACARHRRLGAVMFIDLDNFKNLNDTLGHDKGDQLLKLVAERLASNVRDSDTVARWGGDEFVVILPDIGGNPEESATHAERAAEQLLNAINEPYDLDGAEHHSSPSIGVTLFGQQHDGVDDLLKQADLAMYQAKAAGRNTIRFFDPGMQEVINERVALEADMRQGLQREEFLLHYQPQMDDEGRLLGMEALLRWQHPRRGMVSPADFIPLAEDTGLIVSLGQWALYTACRQLAAWGEREETQRLTMALNISARQFHHPDFVTLVVETLGKTGANPRNLKLELTESVLIDDVEDTVAKMNKLKELGVAFSLDDFGTGYSSLVYLKRLPLGQLKIDQSFVKDALLDQSNAAIVRTIIALGKSLDLDVMAEGVETKEQRDFLESGGCAAFQGYMFSRPLPSEQLEGFMRNTWYR